MNRRRHSRFLAVAAAFGAAALALAACGGGSGSSSSSTAVAAGTPRSGGTLTFAVNTEPDCLDPHVSPADITSVIQRNVFDSLVSQRANGTFAPWLASSWTVSPDARTFTFTLRSGVRFTDGTPFDAAAVKTSFDHITAKSTKSQYAVSLLGSYTGTQVVNPTTARVSFAKPYAAFLGAAATTYLGIESPKQITEHPDQLCAGGPSSVGTGAFVFSKYVRGQSATFTRNPNYTSPPGAAAHQGPAHLSTLVLRFLPEDSARVASLRNGEVDAADAVPPADVSSLSGDDGISLLKVVPQNANYSLYFNTARAPLSDERARKAVVAAINLDQIVASVYFGQYQRAYSNLSPKNVAYDPKLAGRKTYDPATAGRLLDELGYTGRDSAGYRTKDGKRLTLEWPYVGAFDREQRLIVSQAVQADLKKVGIDVHLFSMASGAYTTRRNAGGYDLIAFSWGKSDPDLLRQLYASDQAFTAGGVNGSGLRNPQVDAALAAGAATTDSAKRRAAYATVQEYAINHAYTLPVYVFTRTVGARTRAHGISFDPDAFPLFHDAWVS